MLNVPRAGRVLIVDDSLENLNLLSRILEAQGIEVIAAPSAELALALVDQVRPELALVDVLMPGTDGYALCTMLARKLGSALPVIFISGKNDTESVLKAFAVGGVDYVTKPFHEREVIARVAAHLKLARLQRTLAEQNRALGETNARLEDQVRRREQAESELRSADARLRSLGEQEERTWPLAGFIGRSKAAHALRESVARLNTFPRTHVLISGESGSGKELVARAIHRGSARSTRPFVAINCSAIPPELAESAFFGHVRGAFTGATADRKGCFDLAHEGTLFLDEIGDLPWPLQAKLLRTLEDGSYLPVGATRERRADVRVVCATHADLPTLTSDGRFRQDLYFRLAQYLVHVPALRERREDIPMLARHFLGVFSAEMKRKCPELSDDAVDALCQHPFPGNVRELKNVTERALILSAGSRIERTHVQLLSSHVPAVSKQELDAPADPLNMESMKALLMERALRASGGNVSAAAKLLGVHRSFFYRVR